MQVKTLIHKDYGEMEIHVCNHEKTPQVIDVAKQIDRMLNLTFTGTDEQGVRMIKADDVIRFYSRNQKVYVQDNISEAGVLFKLYELEEKLDEKQFFRISKSEIVNLKKIKRLDMSVAGTIKVIFADDSFSYTSRRNVTRLKQALGYKKGGKEI